MSGLWSEPNVPHKGWTCLEVEDLRVAEGTCEMCTREAIRYVHHMQNVVKQSFGMPRHVGVDGCSFSLGGHQKKGTLGSRKMD
jgi:hypothetical protein